MLLFAISWQNILYIINGTRLLNYDIGAWRYNICYPLFMGR